MFLNPNTREEQKQFTDIQSDRLYGIVSGREPEKGNASGGGGGEGVSFRWRGDVKLRTASQLRASANLSGKFVFVSTFADITCNITGILSETLSEILLKIPIETWP
jgi:hypothetical protein